MAHSLHAYFLRPGAADDDMRFNVQAMRDGNTFTTRRVEAFQEEREIFIGSASFHGLEPGLNHADPMPADVPVPDECPGWSTSWTPGSAPIRSGMNGTPWTCGSRVIPHPAVPSNQAATSRACGSGCARRPHCPTICASTRRCWRAFPDLTLLSVSTVPHPVVFMSNQLQTASIDHAVWFHRRFRADQWLLYDMFSPSASSALGFSNGRLFQEGRLIASCAQEVSSVRSSPAPCSADLLDPPDLLAVTTTAPTFTRKAGAVVGNATGGRRAGHRWFSGDGRSTLFSRSTTSAARSDPGVPALR